VNVKGIIREGKILEVNTDTARKTYTTKIKAPRPITGRVRDLRQPS
jgi:hypothetical protein